MSNDYTQRWAGDARIDTLTLDDGTPLRFLRAGTGPTLLLMHTLRTQLDYFQRLIPSLSRHFTVYAVDLPGMGWSGIRPGARYDEPAVRHVMREFIDRLSLRNLTLVGESMGATLALTLAAQLGSRITRVVAVNPYDYPQGVERANLLASIVIKAMRLPVIGLVPAKAENAVVLGGILRGGFADPSRLPQDFVQELIRSGQRRGFAQVAIAYLRNLDSFIAARRQYGAIRSPVTLVYSDQDWSTPSERDEVARLVPGSRIVMLADTGHFASLERPEAVLHILLEAAGEAIAA